ncbi:iron-containing alcohol dehydrogenase [Luminiphilus sp. nBUS_07]|uniref:iron-containing alcohol dehydrogenase n=1 Tax=Luminiphilus sp. nBUS_07 TaxID=3395314 RepID=UPI003EBA3F7D
MTSFSYSTVPHVRVGPGLAGTLGDECAKLSVRRPLIVTDNGLVTLGLIAPIAQAISVQCDALTIFDGVAADPSEDVVEAACVVARENNVDGVIAVGGGSSMDVAKVVSVLMVGDQSLAEMYGVDQLPPGRLPLFLVPTTAGTGSEVTPVAVITTGATTKAGVSSSVLLPDVAILDAELTLGLPRSATAMTGIDAMVHAIEAYTSKLKKNPISDMLALRALRLLSHNINTVLTQPTDLAAREAMLLGSMFAGQAFANAPVAAVHALAYPLGGHYHIPHGLSNSLMLPAVLAFNAPMVQKDYGELAEELPGGVATSAAGLMVWFDDLIATSGLPATLEAAGVAADDLPMLAADAMLQQRLLVNNPVEVTEACALQLYEKAWSG